ncbi:AfsR/SARP family transcriptional regulator [Streptomyces sp. SP18CS02]|uniref:AfsR/SARP family transcriptional regulator n=1 Tax=Streptomyces sp. SP18CS02 TaxID=3002531 RepID=UPI002E75FC22|nr:tetratricopeptide repeat protein [Streptomyces sp. SP18CS02]MEE1753689.1 tetratricopeptide repeat protein [Streptomyces sp. SP18CS02]
MVDLLALGPLELWHHHQQYELGSVKERYVLAVLTHARGEPVTVDTLMDRVWDGDPPRTALDTLHSYLSRLRGRLRRAAGDLARVERPSPRLYQLRADPEDVDLTRFQRLRRDAGAAAERGERQLAVGLLHAAEALWRGEPLAEFAGSWAASARARLVEDHRRVREERIRLELELGRHADLIGELYELAAQNPLAQGVISLAMLALYRSGRHDEALALYRGTRNRLHDEQGIEPGPALQELHLRILEQDRALMETADGTGRTRAYAPGDSLPRDTRDFTGRTGEMRILLRDPAPGRGSTAMPLTVIHGMPGIGKTALAVHAAHRLRETYPDGQFYVDLHAFSGRPPFEPAEALAVLLQATGATGDLPASLDERVGRWRQWTARHRALVVLDNARDAAQVRPLLPGSPSCRAIVTSRNRLVGLDGATSLFVDVLSRAEAAALFTRIAGAGRLSGASAALARVVEACGRHPLAVQLLASRFRHRDAWDLQHLLDRLAEAADPLDEFDDGVASAFRLSYTELSGPAQRLFRRLALHPGPDITLRAATALAGPGPGTSGAAEVRGGLEELLDGHLLEEPVRDRYRLHDLARAFGLQICARTEPERDRRAAVGRLVAFYLTAAHRADGLAHPHRRALPLGAGRESPYAPGFVDADEASVWLSVERANLLAVARTAAVEAPDHAALFPHVLAASLKLWGTWDIAAELYGAAVPALRALGDRAALARILVERAGVLAQKGHDEALRYATESLALYRDLGDAHGCADALFQSGRAHLAAGHGATALGLLGESLELYRRAGDRFGEAECLNVQGAALYYAGRYGEALRIFRSLVGINEELGDLRGQAMALNNMGELHSLQGRYEQARDHYERSLALVRRCGGRQELAILDTNLGGVYQATGDTARALVCFQRALESHRAGGDALGEANVLISMGTAYAENGRRGEALLHFNMAERVAAGIGSAYERQRALIGVGGVHRESGRLGTALKVYEQALEVAHGIGFPLGAAHALAGLARTALSSRSIALARHYGEQAVALYLSLDAGTEAESLRRLLGDQGVTGS